MAFETTNLLASRFWLCLYGPAGSGKTTTGQALAAMLAVPFVDLDAEIERTAGKPISEIFASQGEAAFREMESAALHSPTLPHRAVIALGGGALLDAENRAWVEAHGRVVCLHASPEKLLERITPQSGVRPLLQGEARERLAAYLESRKAHYASFSDHVDTSHLSPKEAAWRIQGLMGWFHIQGMGAGYDVIVQPGGLSEAGAALAQRMLQGPVGLVTDANVGGFYARPAMAALEQAGYSAALVTLPPGEAHKTLATTQTIWSAFLQAGLERGSTALALGGGVVGDLVGFAASTYLRGMPWAAAPTSLLAMVDASLGGKTGVDLPEGKNLVGAFHPPRLVLADPHTLATLPPAELRSGMAEVIKHAIIADPELFALCEQGLDAIADWPALVRRAIAVKARIIQEDPYEKGRRAALNLGHTIGHAVELVSGFSLSHGACVAIGTVAEARLAVRLGLAEPDLPDQIAACLQACGLPTEIPANLDPQAIQHAMTFDKKKAGGKVRFALPCAIGSVQTGVEVT